ncbi:recombinase family protein [Conexibacter sp. W3-3-2]|uniref:recombinase family protein n=1 Tax=Conexibacter sp. W3-3-2 TaxID=2675227 RepID=UPI0018AC0183|nr:recombinase family protein [Conexibacter sp. W3-3-2]
MSASPPTPIRTAVAYLRVSTSDQATRGGLSEGLSIPAQRQAIYTKAQSMRATVVEEFIDAGESAKTADRPELQRMLRYIRENRVDTVYVHKIDRLARNRADDVAITAEIRSAGATLVSVSENVDETPQGQLMHGIFSAFAEFYSKNLAAEVMKGMEEKVRRGGAVNRAPVGYVNHRGLVNGVESRTIEIDEERAHHVQWAFTEYATNPDMTVTRMTELLQDRGLTVRATAKQPERIVQRSQVHRMLTNPFYTGVVRFKSVEYPGAHTPLISKETFDAVQERLDKNRHTGNREFKHLHYLAGSLYCGRCQSRMIYTANTGRRGITYEYFVCGGRLSKSNDCQAPYVAIETVEGAVARTWRSEHARWHNEAFQPIRAELRERLREIRSSSDREASSLQKRADKLRRDRYKWAEHAMEGTIPADIAREKQAQLARQLATLEAEMASILRAGIDTEATLDAILNLIYEPAYAYLGLEPGQRRTYNQAWWSRIYIDTIELLPAEVVCETTRTTIADALEASRQIAVEALEARGEIRATAPRNVRTPATESDGGSNNQPLVDPAIFESLPKSVDLTNPVGYLFSSSPGRRKVERSATIEELRRAGEVVQQAATVANLAYAHVIESAGVSDERTLAATKVAAAKARQEVWNLSGVPEQFRPMRATALGSQISENRQQFSDERTEALQDIMVASRKRRAELITWGSLIDAGLLSEEKYRRTKQIFRVLSGKSKFKAMLVISRGSSIGLLADWLVRHPEIGPSVGKPGTTVAQSTETGKAITEIIETVMGVLGGLGLGVAALGENGQKLAELLDIDGMNFQESHYTEHIGKFIGGGMKGLGGLTGMTTGILDSINAGEQIKLGGVHRSQGIDQMYNAVTKTMQSTVTTGQGGVDIARTVQSFNHGDKIPALEQAFQGLGGTVAVLSAMMHVKDTARQGAYSHGMLAGMGVKEEDEARWLSALGRREVHGGKATASGIKAAGSVLTAIGTFMGPTPAGPILKIVGMAITGAADAVETIVDLSVGGKSRAKELEAMYGDGSPEALEYVLKFHSEHSAQTIVQKALDGDANAKQALASYGVTELDLKTKSAKVIRELINKAMRRGDGRNLGQKVSEGVGTISRYFGAGGHAEKQHNRDEIAWRTAQAKNLVGYKKKVRTRGEVMAAAQFRRADQVENERKRMIELLERMKKKGLVTDEQYRQASELLMPWRQFQEKQMQERRNQHNDRRNKAFFEEKGGDLAQVNFERRAEQKRQQMREQYEKQYGIKLKPLSEVVNDETVKYRGL